MTDEKVLTERAELAVAELHASGVIFGVISARPPRGLLMLRGQLQITTPVIGFNLVTIASNEFLETDRYQIPTGQWISVAGTAFDFKAPRGIGERIREPTARLEYGGGYDHYFVLSEEKSPRATRLAARIVDQISGRVLEFLATQPGLQFYMGNELNSKVRGRSGLYRQSGGFAIEPHGFPNAANQSDFPSVVLYPTQIYQERTIYRFLVAQ